MKAVNYSHDFESMVRLWSEFEALLTGPTLSDGFVLKHTPALSQYAPILAERLKPRISMCAAAAAVSHTE
jgi:hypothetical protein